MINEVLIDNILIKISDLNYIGCGSEAQIYDLKDGNVLKLFKTPDHPDYAGLIHEQKTAEQKLKIHQIKLREFPKGFPDNVITPVKLVTDKSGNNIVGYTMKFLSSTEVLMMYGERAFHDKGLSNNTVISLFKNLHSTVSTIHKKALIGDFNDLNVLVNNDIPFIIDTDSFQFGKFLTNMFTPRFVDPLICDPKANSLMLMKPYNEYSDWYSFAVMLMQSLLCVDPYGGVYIPGNNANKIPHSTRPLYRITVFNKDVRYPKPAIHFSTLSDDLLQIFHEFFEKDKRIEFPLKVLLDISFKMCYNCGIEFARGSCPVCSPVLAGQVKETLTIKGNVTARTLFKTTGTILFAAVQNGNLKYLYHENGKYIREGLIGVVLVGDLSPSVRYRISDSKTLFGSNNYVAIMEKDNKEVINVDSLGNLPMFDSNSFSKYWVENGELRKDGKFGESAKIGNVLSNRTLFWVGEEFGFGFYRAGNIDVNFIFDAKDLGINDNVNLPKIPGQLVDSTCFFGKDICWFMVSFKDKGKIFNRCTAIDRGGKILAEKEIEANGESWLDTLRGKAAINKFLFAATNDGIVRIGIDNGNIVGNAKFPDTEPFVSSSSHIFGGSGGIYIVNQKEILLLTIA